MTHALTMKYAVATRALGLTQALAESMDDLLQGMARDDLISEQRLVVDFEAGVLVATWLVESIEATAESVACLSEWAERNGHRSLTWDVIPYEPQA
jgi:hypothetical protein